jgi:hypothetical protein
MQIADATMLSPGLPDAPPPPPTHTHPGLGCHRRVFLPGFFTVIVYNSAATDTPSASALLIQCRAEGMTDTEGSEPHLPRGGVGGPRALVGNLV